MVPSSNPVVDDTLNLPSVGCWGAVNTLRFGSQWKVLRVWPWKVTRLLKITNKKNGKYESFYDDYRVTSGLLFP